jgi:type IV pilus assembly protein PilO
MATFSSSSKSAVRSKPKMDLGASFRNAGDQFKGLNFNEPGQWPPLPKIAAGFLVVLLVVIAGWFLLLSGENDNLEAERAKEPTLKQDFSAKLTQAVNLDELLKQKLQVQEYVTQLEKQLPGKAEMDALLSDINTAGLGRGLQFELFRPGQVEVKEYYAELPIALKVIGRYHDIGAFAADIANLSRIVTLHNLNITANTSNTRDPNTGLLSMEATARTYRYLDPSEVEKNRQTSQKNKQGAKS